MSTKWSSLNDRAVAVAKFMLSKRATMRQAAEAFELDKRLVWMDIHERLPEVDPELYKVILGLLEYNKKKASERGGRKTAEFWRQQRCEA